MHNGNMTSEWRGETERKGVKEKRNELRFFFLLLKKKKKERPAVAALLTQASKSVG